MSKGRKTFHGRPRAEAVAVAPPEARYHQAVKTTNRRTAFLASCAALLLTAGCTENKRDIGHETANIVSDTNVMEQAEAAANAVVRNASDCDAVKATLPEADQKLAEAATKIKTQAGLIALQTLKTQVQRVRDLCAS
jgi:hypothetical protein